MKISMKYKWKRALSYLRPRNYVEIGFWTIFDIRYLTNFALCFFNYSSQVQKLTGMSMSETLYYT